mmetsp:Transcript_22538/g.33446  ORF Transcript_22538/g.33446 Transcript_22538/m.33446 type:complete len:202 (-) Transcript_22538:102-707(-)
MMKTKQLVKNPRREEVMTRKITSPLLVLTTHAATTLATVNRLQCSSYLTILLMIYFLSSDQIRPILYLCLNCWMRMYRWALLSLVRWWLIVDLNKEEVPIALVVVVVVVTVEVATPPQRSVGVHEGSIMVEDLHQLMGRFELLLDLSQRTPRHRQQNQQPCHATLHLIRKLILERIRLCTNEILMIGNRSNHFSPRRNHAI